jgi:two-component system response regulator CpxR
MDAQRSLLLVDDDLELCALMSDFFTQQGYRTEAAHDGRDALVRLAGGGYDLIILDVMMPVLDGFEVLQQVRKRSTVPVIMLTARTAGADRVNGLNSGADDYLPKPFEPDELLARIRAVLRRTRKPDVDENRLLESGGVQLNLHTREVWLNRVPVNITTIEFDILECLIRSAGRVVSRDALAAVLYQREATPYERAIDVHISHLRRKLEHGNTGVIHTMRGAGYVFAQRFRRGG